MEDRLKGDWTVAGGIAVEMLTTNKAIPPIPDNRLRLLEMVHQPIDAISMASVVHLVEVDPVLFARVLQLANSPFYRGVEPIVSLRAAITRIGLRDVLNTVGLYCIQMTLPDFPDLDTFPSIEFWNFSWACAVAARRLGHPNLRVEAVPGELYIGGLLHGIGKLIMAIHYPEKFAMCISRSRKLGEPLYKMQQDLFGTVDGMVAAKIMESWNLPAAICSAVAYYQVPEYAPEEHREMAGLIQFAYCLAGRTGIGISGEGKNIRLADTFIGGRKGQMLSNSKIQAILLREVMKSLNEKAGSVAALSCITETSKYDHRAHHSDGSAGIKQKKQGVIAWVRSWFRG